MPESKSIFAFLSPKAKMGNGQKRKADNDHDDGVDEGLHSYDQQHRDKLHKNHSHDLSLSLDYPVPLEQSVSTSQPSLPARGSAESRTSLEAAQDSTLAMQQALRTVIDIHTSAANKYCERIRFLEEGQQVQERSDLGSNIPFSSHGNYYAELEQNSQQLAPELPQTVQELKVHTITHEPKITAGDIISQLDKLAMKIHGLTELRFNGLPLGVPMKKHHEKLFRKMNVDYRDYLKDVDRKALFIEAAIWHKLVDAILSSPAKVFNERMSAAMDEMQGKVLGAGYHTLCTKDEIETRGLDVTGVDEGALHGYHIWRAQTGRLLDNSLYNDHAFYKTGPKDNSYHKLLDDLVGFFGRFCSTPKNLDSLESSLGSIIRQATALARLLTRCQDFHVIRMPTDYFFSKMPKDITLKDISIEDFNLDYMENMDVDNMTEEAIEDEEWIMKPECHGFKLNERLMESISGSQPGKDSDVQLVLSPLILRYTEENAGWTKATVLAKARVLV